MNNWYQYSCVQGPVFSDPGPRLGAAVDLGADRRESPGAAQHPPRHALAPLGGHLLTLTGPCFEHQGSWRHRPAGLWVGRPQGFEPVRACSPSASTPTFYHNMAAASCRTGTLHTAHFFAVCSSQVKHPRVTLGESAPTCTCCPLDGCFVRQVRAHFTMVGHTPYGEPTT